MDSITSGDVADYKAWLLTDDRTGKRPHMRRGLPPATVAKHLGIAAAVFHDAVRRKLLSDNPFRDVRCPSQVNRERQAYVPVEVVERLIEQAPNAEWRLLLAMSRYLGVRVPSEPFSNLGLRGLGAQPAPHP